MSANRNGAGPAVTAPRGQAANWRYSRPMLSLLSAFPKPRTRLGGDRHGWVSARAATGAKEVLTFLFVAKRRSSRWRPGAAVWRHLATDGQSRGDDQAA